MFPPLTGSLLKPRIVGDVVPGETTAASLAALLARREAQAAEAWNHGQAAFAAGDLAAAARWLDRARRIAPQDGTILLVLATVRLHQGQDGEAARLFEAVLARHDLRTAWVGLAQARRHAGDAAGAAAALATALAHHAAAADAGFPALADALAAAAGFAGWCSLDATLRLTASARLARLRLRLDGIDQAAPAGPVLQLSPDWLRGDALEVFSGDRPLLGSPLRLDLMRRLEGCVATAGGDLVGWAWHPHDPACDPVLRIVLGRGRPFSFVARLPADGMAGQMPLARPRRFRVPAASLSGSVGLLHVQGRDGRDLLGSPLEPGAERRSAMLLSAAVSVRYPARRRPRSAAAPPGFAPVMADIVGVPVAPAARTRAAGVATRQAIVMPVHRDLAATRACLDSVLAAIPPETAVIVVDDASPEPALVRYLDALAAAGRIRLIRLPSNRGFPVAANAGLRAAPPDGDVVLLNSDTLVAPGWLQRLAAAAATAPDIGTVTPLSNDATILSYPDPAGGNPVPDAAATNRLAALAHRANADMTVDIPTAVGFCMYIRRACLEQVGLFREDVFAQGYGEENDFCLRARHLGWRHVAAPGVFVAHVGGSSFGAARTHLVARNLALLDRLHPGYPALIADHLARDPLAAARRRLDLQGWRAQRRPARAVLIITHDMGGGVERQVRTRVAALHAAGLAPILLRSDPRQRGICRVEDGAGRRFPNLRFVLPDERAALARLLAAQRPAHVELHHLLGHDHAILVLCRELGVPLDIHVHDYAAFCPRISLIGPERRYCGEPDAVHCESCIADCGRNDEQDISVAALRARSAADLAAARRIVAPSRDTAARIARHFPAIAPDATAWDDAARAPGARRAPRREKMRIVVIGAIGTEKGFEVLLAAARDAAWRALPLEFVVVGYTVDDARLLATGAAFVTGEYQAAELPALLAAQDADLAWIPSIWPETWCFTLSEAWRAGLAAVVFDIGAPAERIRAHGGGLILPLGLPPGSFNNTLLTRRVALWNAHDTTSPVPDGGDTGLQTMAPAAPVPWE